MKKVGRLFVVTALNSMGPVIDPKHNDLLNSWKDVSQAFKKACQPEYRRRFLDDDGNALKFSFFCVSWSGFKTNPVQRDFGWHTIFDYYKTNFQHDVEKWDDAFYWMYNHPAASGIGNEWGLDWEHNTHYLDILNHFIIDRAYFPSVVQIPTERNDTSHFLENWIPFDFGNRNSQNNKLDSINADGKLTGNVLDWSKAPFDWSCYHPCHDNYQEPGTMKRSIFRIVDIKSIVHVLTKHDIEIAFQRCLNGHDTIICAYEHDFRDRYDTIMDLMIEPIFDIRKDYPTVNIFYKSALEAAQTVLSKNPQTITTLTIDTKKDRWRVKSSADLFGAGPYTCIYDNDAKTYHHVPLTLVGKNTWCFPDLPLPKNAIIGMGASDVNGNPIVSRWRYKNSDNLLESITTTPDYLSEIR